MDGRATLVLASVVLNGCLRFQPSGPPAIEFTEIPEAAPGGAVRTEKIAGRASGARAGQQIVLFAKSGTWWVQPLASAPFTPIRADATWTNWTHMGTEYAALLVEPGYSAPETMDFLPGKGGAVAAVASVAGRASSAAPMPPPQQIHFSGYDWDVLQIPSESGGIMHANRASNAWTDAKGWLHLRIARESDQWTCAEISLQGSLGYGTYSFAVQEIPRLEPGMVLGMFTWDPLAARENYREIDVELSQWGDASAKNAQFAIQPYYVPGNVFRFTSPLTALIYSFRWERGRVSFTTAGKDTAKVVAEHVFTSGIPAAGGESVHLNLYTYGKSRIPLQNGVEVVVENFEFHR